MHDIESLAQQKAELDAKGGAEAFPFDPELPLARVYRVQGLEKLRLVPDRRMAANLYELYFLVHANASSETFQRELEREKARKEREELEWLMAMGAKSLDGELGDDLQRVAKGILFDERGNPRKDPETLRYWGEEFKRWRAVEGRS